MSKKISACFMLLFLAAGLAIAAVACVRAWNKTGQFKLEDTINGAAAAQYEHLYNAALPSYELSLNLWSAVNFLTFREGNSGVIVGENNWLYTNEEFLAARNADAMLAEKKDFIADVYKTLKAHNIELLLVPVPAKARIYEEKLADADFPSYKEPVLSQFRNFAGSQNIPFCEISKLLEGKSKQQKIFFATDTHWTPSGARFAAQKIAQCVENKLGDLTLKKVVYQDTGKRLQAELEGDLTRYVPIGALKAEYGLDAESYRKFAYRKIVQPGSGNELTSSSLFGDVDAPDITLVGTSYSANKNWQFAESLQYYLQTDILNAAEEGLGPFETMRDYLANKAFEQTPPKLVIWEIPERYLTMPLNPNQKENAKSV